MRFIFLGESLDVVINVYIGMCLGLATFLEENVAGGQLCSIMNRYLQDLGWPPCYPRGENVAGHDQIVTSLYVGIGFNSIYLSVQGEEVSIYVLTFLLKTLLMRSAALYV